MIGPLTVIFNKTYIVQEVTCENSTAIIIKSCDSADKLFTQKIPIKTGLPNYRRLPQTTADHRRLPQTNVHVHRRPKKIAGKRTIDDVHAN